MYLYISVTIRSKYNLKSMLRQRSLLKQRLVSDEQRHHEALCLNKDVSRERRAAFKTIYLVHSMEIVKCMTSHLQELTCLLYFIFQVSYIS